MKLRNKRIITISLFIVAYLLFIGFVNSLIAFRFTRVDWIGAFCYLGSIGEMFSQGFNSMLCGIGVIVVIIGFIAGLIFIALVKRKGKSKVWAILHLVTFAVITMWSILSVYAAKDSISIAINDIFVSHSLGNYWGAGAYGLYLMAIFFGLYTLINAANFFFILLIKGPAKYVEVEEIEEVQYVPAAAVPAEAPAKAIYKEQVKKELPKREVVKKEEVVNKPVIKEASKPTIKEEPAPIVVPQNNKLKVASSKVESSKPRRIPFEERLAESDKELRDIYKDVKEYVETYGLHSRIANSGESFRLHTICYLKITVAGKKLKLYYKLKPEDYKDSTIPLQDVSNKKIYEETPLALKVKSGLSIRRCKELIDEMMKKEGISKKAK